MYARYTHDTAVKLTFLHGGTSDVEDLQWNMSHFAKLATLR